MNVDAAGMNAGATRPADTKAAQKKLDAVKKKLPKG